jgi:hypothetical protein
MNDRVTRLRFAREGEGMLGYVSGPARAIVAAGARVFLNQKENPTQPLH